MRKCSDSPWHQTCGIRWTPYNGLNDEPIASIWHYLSLDVLEAFESAIPGFPGPVIAVSHDRWFIQRFGGAESKSCRVTGERRVLQPPGKPKEKGRSLNPDPVFPFARRQLRAFMQVGRHISVPSPIIPHRVGFQACFLLPVCTEVPLKQDLDDVTSTAIISEISKWNFHRTFW